MNQAAQHGAASGLPRGAVMALMVRKLHLGLQKVRAGGIKAWRTKQGSTKYQASVREDRVRVAHHPPLVSRASQGERLHRGEGSLL